MKVTIIRHGKTKANKERRYCGCRSDEPLSEEGRAELKPVFDGYSGRYASRSEKQAPAHDACGEAGSGPLLFVSPMTRAVQTAEILFPGIRQTEVDEFREMDFGSFEGFCHDELDGDPVYQAWIDSGCESDIPGGESKASFTERTMKGFFGAVRAAASMRGGYGSAQDESESVPVEGGSGKDENGSGQDENGSGWDKSGPGKDISGFKQAEEPQMYIVAHGGTVMAIMSELTGEGFYDFHSGNGCGYTIDLEVDDAGNIIAAGAYDRFCGGLRAGSSDR